MSKNLVIVESPSKSKTIEKYLGSATDVIIPSTIDGYEVKGIDYDAFLNSKISKVTIPEGITRISFEAFKNCESLSTVNFNAVNCEGTVSPVFAGCKNLKTINIGSKVTLIGSYMFANVPAENIVLPTSVKEIDYEDELLVDQPEPLISYILSCHGNQHEYLNHRYLEFKDFVRKKMAAKGVIKITKSAGIFICKP